MGRIAGFVGLIIVLCIGAIIYTQQLKSTAGPTNLSPTTTINATGVRMDLLAIANAEKKHFATDGKYLSLDELRTAEGPLPADRKDFTYSVEVNDKGFRAIATYTGSEANALHAIVCDQDLKVTGES